MKALRKKLDNIYSTGITKKIEYKDVISQKRVSDEQLDFIYLKKSDFWMRVQKQRLVSLFKMAALKIPAYSDFLKRQKIKALTIRSYDDFSQIPPTNKDNYLRYYLWEDLLIPNSLVLQSLVLTSTSGSNGKPFYFPRNDTLDIQSSIYHQMFTRNSDIDLNKSTLILICFGMGVWIGGIITYEAFKSISERGYPMTILAPGVNKKEIFEALNNIGHKYDQIILCGYPPFIKDIVDEAPSHNVDWKDYHIKIIFAAESFSEKFRDYIMKKTGMINPYRDTMNIYGSADLGTMAEETPISILIRRIALRNKTIYKKLFGQGTRLPTLAQYIPDFISFESVGKSIYVSGNNVLPLIRYEIGDNGGVISFKDVEKIFIEEGIDLCREAKRVHIFDTIAELPFVFVYERTDLSTKLYGAIIYPEYIKAGLQNRNLERYITGRFTIFTKHNKNQDEYLEVNVELKLGVRWSKSLEKEVTKKLINSLTDKSAEYKYLYGMIGEKVRPTIVFWEHEHPTHFQIGIKQKWVKKQ